MDLDELTPPWLAHLLPSHGGSAPDPITFPATPLRVKVSVAPGADLTADPSTWPWADVTEDIYQRDAISVTRGRADEAAVADTSSFGATANNRSGRWSTRNPNSPWYGQLRKGTPIWLQVEGFTRFTGFLSAIPPRWDVSGNDKFAPLEAKGLFYRLTQGASPERSAIRRSLAAAAPVAYWSMEDSSDSTVFASAVPDGAPATMTGTVYPAVDGTLPGSGNLPDFTPGGSVTFVNSSTAGTTWRLDFWALIPAALGSSIVTLISFVSTGTVNRFDITADALGGGINLTYYDATGAHSSSGSVSIDDNEWHHISLRSIDAGGGLIQLALYLDGIIVCGSAGLSATVGTITIGTLNPGRTTLIGAIGHLGIWSAYNAATTYSPLDAGSAYDGELAHVRFARLCDEEGIVNTCVDAPSAACGPQRVAAILPLLRDLEAADGGYLYEGLDFGIVFRPHSARENRAVALALDYATPGHISPPLEPTDDDQQARNDVEVKRENGSASRLVEEDPNTELSIPNIGRRDESTTLELYSDDQTLTMAGLRLVLGTWPGYRFPVLTVNFTAAPTLIPAFCEADLAFRTTIDNPPDDIGPDLIDLFVEGYTETITDQFEWSVSANCSPAGPWHIFETAAATGDTNPYLGYLIPTTCVLAEDLDTTEPAVDVTTTTALWSTSADDWTPGALVVVEGETMLVTAVSGGSNPQTLTVTRSVNGVVKTHAAGANLEFVSPGVLGY